MLHKNATTLSLKWRDIYIHTHTHARTHERPRATSVVVVEKAERQTGRQRERERERFEKRGEDARNFSSFLSFWYVLCAP